MVGSGRDGTRNLFEFGDSVFFVEIGCLGICSLLQAAYCLAQSAVRGPGVFGRDADGCVTRDGERSQRRM